MERLWERRVWVLGLAALGVGTSSCGDGGNDPGETPPAIAKNPNKSGDAQAGPVGEALPAELSVVVTRDGAPASNVTVTWATDDGTLSPASDKTDLNGVSTSVWTLGDTPGEQAASASVENGTGSPVAFTATGTTGSAGGPVVQVVSAGGFRFSPADITVTVGTTVTWEWAAAEAVNHNVSPDGSNTIPARSGGLVSAPHTYQFTFNTPGTYGYHCEAHGSPGNGMAGTVTVVSEQP